MACDLFTMEMIRLQTLHVLFFIQLSTRRVVAAGVTANPDSAWVTQQARNAAMDLNDRGVSVRFLPRDHDAKFSRGFDEVFGSEGVKVLRTPIRAPKANAYAERWVQTVRAECLDWTLVLGRRHLLRLLRGYVRHDNEQRPHRGLALAVPKPEVREQRSPQVNPGEVKCREVLGGLIHEYHEVAGIPASAARRHAASQNRYLTRSDGDRVLVRRVPTPRLVPRAAGSQLDPDGELDRVTMADPA